MIRPAHALGAESTWVDYVTWYGIHVGELREETLLADAAELAPEVRVLALGELCRRRMMEDEPSLDALHAQNRYMWAVVELRRQRRREQADRCPGWLDTSGQVQP